MTDRTCDHGYLPHEYCSACSPIRHKLHFDAPSGENARATIARLTAALDNERQRHVNTESLWNVDRGLIEELRRALAEYVQRAVEAETRACAEAISTIVGDGDTLRRCMETILARLDQPKGGEGKA